MSRIGFVTAHNIFAHRVVIPAWHEVRYCYSVETLESFPAAIEEEKNTSRLLSRRC